MSIDLQNKVRTVTWFSGAVERIHGCRHGFCIAASVAMRFRRSLVPGCAERRRRKSILPKRFLRKSKRLIAVSGGNLSTTTDRTASCDSPRPEELHRRSHDKHLRRRTTQILNVTFDHLYRQLEHVSLQTLLDLIQGRPHRASAAGPKSPPFWTRFCGVQAGRTR